MLPVVVVVMLVLVGVFWLLLVLLLLFFLLLLLFLLGMLVMDSVHGNGQELKYPSTWKQAAGPIPPTQPHYSATLWAPCLHAFHPSQSG